MICDLKPEELVNRIQRGFVIGNDLQPRSAWCFFQIPVQLVFQPGHNFGAGNVRAMHQHGRVEITCGEHFGDVLEMFADLIAARGVLHVVGSYVDHAPIVVEFKVMGSALVRESHYMIAMGVYRRVMILGKG